MNTPKIFCLVTLILLNCSNSDRAFNIKGTWGATIDSFYREYTFTDTSIVVYDDYFGAQVFKYTLQNDTVKVSSQSNRGEIEYYILNGYKNKLRLMVETEKILDMTKVQTNIDFQRIIDGDEREFNKYVAIFNLRNDEK